MSCQLSMPRGVGVVRRVGTHLAEARLHRLLFLRQLVRRVAGAVAELPGTGRSMPPVVAVLGAVPLGRHAARRFVARSGRDFGERVGREQFPKRSPASEPAIRS